MDFKEIQDLVKLANKSELSELKVEQGDFKVTIRTKHYSASNGTVTYTQAAPVATSSAATAETVSAESTEDSTDVKKKADAAINPNYITIKSPMIGTFYRSPGPDKDVFVKVGDTVEKGTVLCIIEAMKLFNEIESELGGTIIKVLAEDASPVEYDQPLFIIDPS